MLDFSWSELLMVAVVAIIAIGPKQLPDMLYGLGRIVRRLQYMRFALGKQFDDFMEQSDLAEMRKISDHVHEIGNTIHHVEHDEIEAEKKIAAEEKNGEKKNGGE
ncbi:MAG TPA: twin-arginine translocase TatA/TatE family subunit [Alphaproteobacteria bacterium]|nr:twin-arginine translocase TatA/TatE family subunit [Alphaproteobacteria bacterium]HNS45330.1 twin-arginine translocase TatA/TatE family subunit [Alphaproteobacteria bacterium]